MKNINYKTKATAHRKWSLRIGMLGAVAVFATATVAQMFQPAIVEARDFDAEIKNLQKQVDSYNAQASEKNAQANTLQGKIDELKAQQRALQAQINLSSAKRESLEQQIADSATKLKDQAQALRQNLQDQYYSGNTTSLDILLNSDSVSDYVDRQTRQSAITDGIKKTVSQVRELKTQQENNKKEVERVIAQQNNQKDQLSYNQSEQQKLLEQTKGDEAKFREMQKSKQAEMAKVQKQREDAIAALKRQQEQSQQSQSGSKGNSNGSNSGSYNQPTKVGSFEFTKEFNVQRCGGGGYPYCGAQDTYPDKWGMLNRECVSWAAWRISTGYGKVIPGYPKNAGNGRGNAANWPRYSGGRAVNNPRPGDAAIIGTSIIPVTGHAMVVESVGSDGWVTVSQYNWTRGSYSQMKIRGSGITYLRF